MGRFKGLVKSRAEMEQTVVPVAVVPERRIGRPRGKRTDPAFRQVSAWVRKDTYGAVRGKLFTGGDSREFSELVQSLLEKWLSE